MSLAPLPLPDASGGGGRRDAGKNLASVAKRRLKAATELAANVNGLDGRSTFKIGAFFRSPDPRTTANPEHTGCWACSGFPRSLSTNQRRRQRGERRGR